MGQLENQLGVNKTAIVQTLDYHRAPYQGLIYQEWVGEANVFRGNWFRHPGGIWQQHPFHHSEREFPDLDGFTNKGWGWVGDTILIHNFGKLDV